MYTFAPPPKKGFRYAPARFFKFQNYLLHGLTHTIYYAINNGYCDKI